MEKYKATEKFIPHLICKDNNGINKIVNKQSNIEVEKPIS